MVLNSPIKWVGGKKNLRKAIVDLIPNHMQYVEVFGGAAWVLLEKEKSKLEIFNDINGDLINFYKVIQDTNKLNVLTERLLLTPKSRELFEEWDKIYTSKQYEDDIQRALIFYYILKLVFGGRMNRSKSSFVIPNDGRKQINYDKFPDEFQELHDRIKDVYIENKDFEYILSKYDRKDGDVVFYLDPPYLDTTEDDYGTTFNLDTYKRLKYKLSQTNGKWILTCNDCEDLRGLFREYNIKSEEVHYSISGTSSANKKYGELIITNYEIKGDK